LYCEFAKKETQKRSAGQVSRLLGVDGNPARFPLFFCADQRSRSRGNIVTAGKPGSYFSPASGMGAASS
jgi:hypothetical protein